MYLKRLLSVFSISAALIISGCSFSVATPSTTLASHVTPGILDKGAQEIEIENHVATEIFGPAVEIHQVSYSQGLTDSTELKVSAFAGIINPNDTIPLSRMMGGVSVLYQYNPTNNHLGLYGGGGVGFSKYGNFISSEGGIVVGYDNRYLVPYIQLGGFASVPYFTRAIKRERDDYHSSGTEIKYLTKTIGAKVMVGLHAKMGQHFRIWVDAGMSAARSETDALLMLNAGAGIGYQF
ncbi:MAG: hypothetical protein OCC49_15355 [Fibrobacterales bacterium]